MKLTKELQVCIKTGILLAVIGTAKSATERVINRTTEIVTIRYETPKANVSTTNISVVSDETNLTELPALSGDSDASTTQKYDNSKLLFSYVVPVTSERAKAEEIEEEEDSEDVAVDEEEEDEDRGNLEEEEEEEERENLEEEEEEEERENLEEEEEEEDRGNLEEEEEEEKSQNLESDGEKYSEVGPYHRREDHAGGKDTDDSDEEHYEAEDEEDHGRTDDEVSTERGSTREPINPWRHGYPQLIRERRPFFEITTVQPFSAPRPVSYSSVVYDPDGKSKTELSGSFYKKPLEVVPESGVFPAGGEHSSEDTQTVPVTSPPVIEERSVQAPISKNEYEEEDDDNVKEEPKEVMSNANFKVQSMTTLAPKPIQPQHSWEDEEEEEEEEEEDYKEPEEDDEKVQHTTPNKTAKKIPRLDFDWEEEYYGDSEARTPKHSTPVTPKRAPKSVKPTVRQNWIEEDEEDEGYIEPEAVTSNVNYNIQESTPAAPKKAPKAIPRRDTSDWEKVHSEELKAITKKSPEVAATTPDTPKRAAKAEQNWEEEEDEDYIEPEAVTSNVHYDIQESTPVTPKWTPKPVHNTYWEEEDEEEPRTARYEKREYFEAAPKGVPDDSRYKTSQQFRDKSNRENYYEQTINTRFGSKERGTSEEDKNYESEVGDLMKPKTENWREETVQKNIVSEEEEEPEPEEMTERDVPVKKDRNQLYEYLIADGRFKQRVAENKDPLPYVLTTPNIVQTTTTAEPLKPPTTAKPTTTPKPKQAKPQSYSFGTVTNPQSDKFITFNSGDTNDVTYKKIVSNIQSLFAPPTPRPTANYEQHFLPSHGNCRHQLPDSINYETFIKPSETRPSYEEESEESEEEEESPMPKRLPMKTYLVQRRPAVRYRAVKKPSSVKVTVQPMIYREAKPASYRNAVYLGSPNQLLRKVVHYSPKKYPYSSTNQIHQVIRPPKRDALPSSRMLIIRKIERTPS